MNASLADPTVATVSRYSLRDLFVATTLITLGVAWLNYLIESSRNDFQESWQLLLAGGIVGAGACYPFKKLSAGVVIGMGATVVLVSLPSNPHTIGTGFAETFVLRYSPNGLFFSDLISPKTFAAMLLGTSVAIFVERRLRNRQFAIGGAAG